MSEATEKSTTGIQPNLASVLCYLGWWVTGIIFLVLEKENKLVRFHAAQSIIVFGLIFVVLTVLSWIPFIGTIIWLLGAVLWIVMMYMAYQGKKYKLPWAGDLAEKYSKTAFMGTSVAKTEEPKKE